MSGWILIITIIFSGSRAGGAGVAMQEFSTIEHCQYAAKQWKKSAPKGYSPKLSAVCVPK